MCFEATCAAPFLVSTAARLSPGYSIPAHVAKVKTLHRLATFIVLKYSFDAKNFLTYQMYSSEMVELFTEVYNWLPLAHLINNKVMVGEIWR